MGNEKGKQSKKVTEKSFGEERFGWVWPFVGALFSMAAIGFFAFMVSQSAPAKNLVCNGSHSSLTSFGSCKAQ